MVANGVAAHVHALDVAFDAIVHQTKGIIGGDLPSMIGRVIYGTGRLLMFRLLSRSTMR